MMLHLPLATSSKCSVYSSFVIGKFQSGVNSLKGCENLYLVRIKIIN